ILLRVNSSSVSHCGRFANSRLDLRRSARLILCIGGVLLLAGSPGWVSATPKATPPFPYFHTCWLYLREGSVDSYLQRARCSKQFDQRQQFEGHGCHFRQCPSVSK